MSITITEDKETKKEPIEKDVVEKTLEAVKEADKIRAENDQLAAELARREELWAKAKLGGRADAGSKEKSQEETDAAEASKHLATFQTE